MDPIFIVGVPRSGTTLVRMVLDTHPNIYSGSEMPWLGGNYGSPEVSLRGLYERMKNDRYSSPLYCMSHIDEDFIINTFRNFVSSIINRQLSILGKNKWVEKTPDNIIQVPFLHKLFPNAKFIHIIRDGRDVAISTINTNWKQLSYFKPQKTWKGILFYFQQMFNINPDRIILLFRSLFPYFGKWWRLPSLKDLNTETIFYYYPVPNTYYNSLWRWREWINKYEQDIRTLKVNSLTIRYEDITREPQEWFSKILEFIGESWSPEILLYKDYQHETVYNDTGADSCLKHSGISSTNIGKWKKELTWGQKRWTSRYFDDFLVEKGYERTI